ncbi:hypothetical protein ACWEIJ_28240 [Lentzea sp. NPDC004789]
MSRPTKATPGGRAYLDLQNRARRERRPTQELQTLYVVGEVPSEQVRVGGRPPCVEDGEEHASLQHEVAGARGSRQTSEPPFQHVLSEVIGDLAELRQQAYSAFKKRLGPDGGHLPDRFGDVVAAVVEFVDPLTERSPWEAWDPDARKWT